jgi:hypothetical protein
MARIPQRIAPSIPVFRIVFRFLARRFFPPSGHFLWVRAEMVKAFSTEDAKRAKQFRCVCFGFSGFSPCRPVDAASAVYF